jgi:ABC-type transport system involved in multi-copper enzyme maturation permease subunit
VTALLRFEWRRLRSLRGNWAMVTGVVAFALAADLAAAGGPLDAEGAVFHLVQRDLALRWLVAAAIGAQAFGHDFRYATNRPTLLAFPRRGRLLAGRAAAAALAGTAVALLASVASLALLLAVTGWGGGLLVDLRLWRSLAVGVVSTGLVAALAVGVGALTRGAGLAVVLLALWAAVLEPLTAVALGGGAVALLPFLSMLQLAGYTGDALGVGATGPLSAAVFPLCLLVTLAAAAAALARRDAALF